MTDERTDLSELVRSRRAELRLGLRGLAERCTDPENPAAGSLWTRTTLNTLETGKIKPPRLPELRALARGLDLPLGKIQDAAGAQFFGIDTLWSASGEARALVERADRMTPEQRAQLMRLLDAFAEGNAQSRQCGGT
jgi:transcriptional regulator with XRE-family HTH domain